MEANKKKIRIAICGNGGGWGGIESFIYSYCKFIKEETNYKLIVLLFHDLLLASELRKLGIKIVIIPTKYLYDFTVLLKLLRILKDNCITIIHTHGHKANIIAGIAGRLLKITIIKTEHGLAEPHKSIKYSIHIYLDHLMKKYIIDAIVYVSNEIFKREHKLYLKTIKYVIHNGIDFKSIDNNKACQVPNLLDNRKFKLGVIGRLIEVKGQLYLLKAIKVIKVIPEIKKIKLYIFGEGPDEKHLRDFCEKNNLCDIVQFMGFKENIVQYMRELDALVVPSVYEGIPFTILEAMYLKIPIIATQVGGIKEILNKKSAILIPPKDIKGIANAILKIFKDKNTMKTISNNAFQTVLTEHSIESVVTKYFNLYNEIFQKRNLAMNFSQTKYSSEKNTITGADKH